MNNDDLSILSAVVAEKLFDKLYGGKELDLVQTDKNMSYCALVTDFVLNTFRQEVEKALNEEARD
jgi:hypothetical protein